MADLFHEIRFQDFRASATIIAPRWTPGDNSVRRGDLTVTVVAPEDYDTVSVTLRPLGKALTKTCTRAEGGDAGCTLTFERVDACHVAAAPIEVGIRRRSHSETISTSLQADYVVVKVSFWAKITEQTGRELERTAPAKSAICR